ncbi:MAG TPA: (d)CMP kinase, partial [Aliicoccus persicus]|nr:(d)CMP kinase [Aliicoccus persicus]
SMEVNQNVSRVSSLKIVREFLVDMQREIAKDKGVVMDGRDIGTTVLPDSELKIYMNASPEVRAERRFIEEQKKGIEIDMRTLTEQIRKRDEQDKSRALSPLRKAEDALFLDTSYMTIEEVTQKIIELAEEIVRGDQ